MSQEKELISQDLKEVEFEFIQVKSNWREKHSEELLDLSDSLIIDNFFHHISNGITFHSNQSFDDPMNAYENSDYSGLNEIKHEIQETIGSKEKEYLFDFSSSRCSSIKFDKYSKEMLISFEPNQLSIEVKENQTSVENMQFKIQKQEDHSEKMKHLGSISTTYILGIDNKYRLLQQCVDSSFLQLVRRTPSEMSYQYLRFGQLIKHNTSFQKLQNHLENSLLTFLSSGFCSLSQKSKFSLNSDISVIQTISTLPHSSPFKNDFKIENQISFSEVILPHIFTVTQNYSVPIQNEQNPKDTTLIGLFYSKQIKKRVRLSKQSSIVEDSYQQSASLFASKFYSKQYSWRRRGKNQKMREMAYSFRSTTNEESHSFSNMFVKECESMYPQA